MSPVHRCPSCGREHQVDRALVGRRVRCSQCGEVARVAGEAPAPPPPPPSPLPAAPARPTRGKAGRGRKPRPARPLSDGERRWVATGAQAMVVGALALALPLFGLELRRLGRARAIVPGAGLTLLVIGALILLVIHARRNPLRTLKIAGAALGCLVALSLAARLSIALGWNFRRILTAPFRAIPPQLGGQAPPPAIRDRADGAGPPSSIPLRADGAGPFARPGPPPPPRMEGPTVRLILQGAAGVATDPAFRRRLKALCDPGPSSSVTVSSGPRGAEATLAPVADLDAFASRVDFGRVLDVDRSRRVLTIAVDRPPDAP